MDGIVYSVLNHLLVSLKLALSQIFILIGPGLILAFLMNLVAGSVETSGYRLLGRGIYLGVFGWLGTIVHEAGHAGMCIAFRHRITEIEFFNPDPVSGTLGYVNHSYNRDSIYQTIGNFFIGIGPIILGTIVIYYSARYLVSETLFLPFNDLQISYLNFRSIHALKELLSNVWRSFSFMATNIFTIENLSRWQFYAFFYILFCVGSSMSLSRPDIKGAWSGFSVFFTLLFIMNVIALIFGGISSSYFVTFTKYYLVFYAVMVFVILMNTLLAIPLYLLRGLMT